MSSGALTPKAAVEAIYHDALHHLDEPIHLAFVKNIAGGLQIGLAGLAALYISGGCPSLKENNEGIVNWIEGSIFSVGLILVYFTGAELYTGYPMWLAIAALKRARRPMSFVNAFFNSLLGNLVGALFAAAAFGYGGRVLTEEPMRSFVVEKVNYHVADSEWHVIFLKAIPCGYLVTLAMMLGTQNLDGVSKAMALYLPFVLATATQLPHTVEFMHLASLGVMLGSRLTVGQYLWKCLLPIILGNFVGGAFIMGLYHWWVFLVLKNGEVKGDTFGERIDEYRDADDDE